MDDVSRAVKKLVDQGVDAIAICFLWVSETRVTKKKSSDILTKTTWTVCSISSEVMPVIREYERSVVTLVNSYIAKIMRNI